MRRHSGPCKAGLDAVSAQQTFLHPVVGGVFDAVVS